MDLATLTQRLHRLEAAAACRTCLTRYLQLCDDLTPATPWPELGQLFAEDAVWEGIGPRYAASFGRHEGRAAILTMVGGYVAGGTHFQMNAHFLTSEHLVVNAAGDHAVGSWLMLQTSRFHDGRSHLTSAQLTVQFVPEDGRWCMSLFQTQNIFSRPISDWDSNAALSVPPAALG
ncbi:MAG: nuclear transport factor 2 family protein [Neisseriaceae bacterium]|nr:nuclear transport factor 2 family protein [Neisseriaceae bacterium]